MSGLTGEQIHRPSEGCQRRIIDQFHRHDNPDPEGNAHKAEERQKGMAAIVPEIEFKQR